MGVYTRPLALLVYSRTDPLRMPALHKVVYEFFHILVYIYIYDLEDISAKFDMRGVL
jgi:hypothetical protein